MQVVILLFSPTGNTLKVTKMIEKNLIEKGVNVQLLDITCHQELFDTRNFAKYLEDNIQEHDLLCIGGPVYAERMQYNILDLIKNLPKSDKKWSKETAVFVTYGQVSSGIALSETAKYLRKTDRIVIAGMKIDSSHSFNSHISLSIGEGKPGEEALPIINDFCDRIIQFDWIDSETSRYISKSFDYLPFKKRISAKILYRERLIHNVIYPKIKFDSKKCQKCNICISQCPVQCIEMNKDCPKLKKGGSSCIHCGVCVEVCPQNAITFNIQKFEGFLKKWTSKTSSHYRNEGVRSAVYPLKEFKK